MKNQKGFSALILISITAGLLIVCGGGYYYWKIQSKKVPNVNVNENKKVIPVSDNSGAVATSTDFMVYRNAGYGVEFMYPKGWVANDDPRNNGVSIKPSNGKGSMFMEFGLIPNKDNYVGFKCQNTADVVSCVSAKSKNGVDYIREITADDKDPEKYRQLVGYFATANYDVRMAMRLSDPDGNKIPGAEENTKIFDDILASLKLIK